MVRVLSTKAQFIGELNLEYVGGCTEYHIDTDVPYGMIQKAVSNGSLIRLERGIYATPELIEDEYFLIQMKYSRGVFSGFSAMYLQNMSDHLPENYHMTFPKGYNSKTLREDPRPIVIKRVMPKLYDMGITVINTAYGNPVRVYDRERTLCDILRGQGIDADLTKHAMREYVGSGDVNIRKLVSYADALHVRSKIDSYIRVLL